jgi:hypothetical protein
MLYYLDFLIVTLYIYISKKINLILTKQQGVGYKLVSKFCHTITRSLGMECYFSQLLSIFHLHWLLHFYATKLIIKHQVGYSLSVLSLKQATDHTCTLT